MSDVWTAQFTENGHPLAWDCGSLLEAVYLLMASDPERWRHEVIVCPDGEQVTGQELDALIVGTMLSEATAVRRRPAP